MSDLFGYSFEVLMGFSLAMWLAGSTADSLRTAFDDPCGASKTLTQRIRPTVISAAGLSLLSGVAAFIVPEPTSTIQISSVLGVVIFTALNVLCVLFWAILFDPLGRLWRYLLQTVYSVLETKGILPPPKPITPKPPKTKFQIARERRMTFIVVPYAATSVIGAFVITGWSFSRAEYTVVNIGMTAIDVLLYWSATTALMLIAGSLLLKDMPKEVLPE